MYEVILICLVTFIGAGLTLFSGFGLGTLLVPVFGLFFSIDLAIVLTAIVHFLNNLFKLFLLGRHASKTVVLRFGIPSVLAALLGAWLLTKISGLGLLFTYSISGKMLAVTPVKLCIALLLMIFACIELLPSLKNRQFDAAYLPLGGLLSGFFGGLSGHQGALRSAFIMKAGLSKEAFIATGVVIACLVDASRLSIYLNKIVHQQAQLNYPLLILATLAAFTGSYFGSLLVKKVTIAFLQKLVAVMLLIFALLLGAGII